MNILEAHNLTVNISKNFSLHIPTLEFPSPLFCALMGKNGSGKTSMLRSFCRLIKIKQGQITINGKNLAQLSGVDLAKKIAWVPHNINLPFDFTSFEIALLGRYANHLGCPTIIDKKRVEQTFSDLGISEFKHRIVTTLSSGEQQKVLIARALASDAQIVLLDEPNSNLDVFSSIQLMKVLKNEVLTKNRLIIAAMHQIELAHQFADAFMMMRNGQLIGNGPMHQLQSDMLIQGLGIKAELVDSGAKQRLILFV